MEDPCCPGILTLCFVYCYGTDSWNNQMQAYADTCSDTLHRRYSMFLCLHTIDINKAATFLQNSLYENVTTALENRINGH
uniref:Uncharacterized protein n=1 Tax=Romanomermis culicivorax TaxID=13658 RepID=A0A915J3F6_ROMCU